jgi:hypothetical protein
MSEQGGQNVGSDFVTIFISITYNGKNALKIYF